MRKVLGRLLVLGAAAGAVFALRNYLEGSHKVKPGDVQIVLDSGATIEPGSTEAREFVDIAREVLEISGQAR